MSRRELQTHAARVLHVERMSEVDAEGWRLRFGYHPLDVEAIFQAPIESTFSTYGGYGFLTLLWPDLQHGETTELRIFLQPQQLTIIGDTRDHLVRDFLASIETDPTRQLSSSAELLADLVSRFVGSTVTMRADRVAAIRLTSMVLALRQCARWLNEQSQGRAVAQLILLAHRLDHAIDQLRVAPTTTPIAPRTLPRMLGAYTAIATVMVVAVIVTLSFHA